MSTSSTAPNEALPEYVMVGVDVGVTNFAYCKVLVKGRQTELIACARYDLADMDGCADPHCPVQRHARDACCRLRHLLLRHPEILDGVDALAVEQQPPTGLKDVEQTLVALAETRGLQVSLCSPRAMHAHYRIQHLDYNERKRWVENLYERSNGQPDAYRRLARKHDVADAFAIAKYMAYTAHRNALAERDKARKAAARMALKAPSGQPLREFLQQFAYVPRHRLAANEEKL